MPGGRPKGSRDRLPQVEHFIAKIEEMLKKGDPSNGTLERLACRMMLHPANDAMETKFFQKDGEVTDERDVINWSARLEAQKLAFQIWRVLLAYKYGAPTQPVELSGAVGLVDVIAKARARVDS